MSESQGLILKVKGQVRESKVNTAPAGSDSSLEGTFLNSHKILQFKVLKTFHHDYSVKHTLKPC